MNYFSALVVVLGIASALISIYEFIKKGSWRPGIAFSIAAVVLLVAAGIVANLPSSTRSQASGPLSTQSSTTSPSGTGNTPITTQPPPQIPSPTSPPGPGTVLYQADQSWSGWSGTKEWNVLNGMLTNDGTGYPGQPTILAPYQLQVSNYAVEANIQVVNWHRCCYSQYAIVVRASTNSDGGWQGYSVGEDLEDRTPSTANIAADAGHIGSALANAPFDPGTAWHTYRVEVKGNTIKLLIDGGVKIDITDNTYLSGRQVGFWSYEVQLNISSFKIIAL